MFTADFSIKLDKLLWKCCVTPANRLTGTTLLIIFYVMTTECSYENTDIRSLLNVNFFGQRDMEILFVNTEDMQSDVYKENITKKMRYSLPINFNGNSYVMSNGEFIRSKRDVEIDKGIKGKQLIKMTPKTTTKMVYRFLSTTVNKNRLSVPRKMNKFTNELLTKFRQYLPIAFKQIERKRFPYEKIVQDLIITNVIGILPGRRRGFEDDHFIVVGAHFDTVKHVKGVYDNGSGLAVVLEIARLLGTLSWQLEHTIIFVCFDFEEHGTLGSMVFINDYLLAKVISAGKGTLRGAYIYDSILLYNATENTHKIIEEFYKGAPEFAKKIEKNKFKGDFVSVWARKGYDDDVANKLAKYWDLLDKPEYKLFVTDIDNAKLLKNPGSMFRRSDHYNFWRMLENNISLSAILGTDGGEARLYGDCMHQSCDNINLASPEGVNQLKKTIDATLAAVLDFAEGRPHDSQCEQVNYR